MSVDPGRLTESARLHFAGFGCGENPCGGNGPGCPSPDLRSGSLRVWKQPSPGDVTFTAVGSPEERDSYVSAGDSGGPVCTDSGDRVVGVVRAGCEDDWKWRSSITSLAAGDTVRWMCEWVCEEPAVRRIRGLQCGGCAG